MTTDRRFHRAALGAAAVLASAALVVACGDDDDEVTGAGGDDEVPEQTIEIEDAWARSSPKVADAGAVYMTIENDGDADDALIGVSVDESVAGAAELHETVDMDGMMKMQPVEEVAVPADGEAVLEPGGYHVMLLELAQPLEVGADVELVLTFETAGEVEVSAEVREAGM